MIYEMRTYQLKIGTLQKYLKQFEEKGLPIVRKYCTLVGYWTVETGHLNRVIHIWSFKDMEDRRKAREKWWQDKDWIEGYVPSRPAAGRVPGKHDPRCNKLLADPMIV